MNHDLESLTLTLNSFHTEMALLGDLCVNLQDFLCDVLFVHLRAIP
jgi:hypothetical protein